MGLNRYNTTSVSVILNKKDYNDIINYINDIKNESGYKYKLSELLNECINLSFSDKMSNLNNIKNSKISELEKGSINTIRVGIVLPNDVFDEFAWMKEFIFKDINISELRRIFILNGFRLKKTIEGY